jgi:hypothetical protein
MTQTTAPVITYDKSAQVFELWASEAGHDYLGCFDTREEAAAYFRKWMAEQ